MNLAQTKQEFLSFEEVKDKYRSRIAFCKTQDELYDIMCEIIEEDYDEKIIGGFE